MAINEQPAGHGDQTLISQHGCGVHQRRRTPELTETQGTEPRLQNSSPAHTRLDQCSSTRVMASLQWHGAAVSCVWSGLLSLGNWTLPALLLDAD